MLDSTRLIQGLASVFRDNAPLRESALARALDLDFSHAAVTRAKTAIAIHGATTNTPGETIEIAISLSPKEMVYLVFDSPFAVGDLARRSVLHVNPRIERSKSSDGYSILYDFGDCLIGATVTGEQIQTVFGEAKRTA